MQDKDFYKVISEGGFEADLSLDRFQRYLNWSKNNKEKAFFYYAVNMLFSQSFYIPLNMLEIILRNKIHDALSEKFGRQWYLDGNIIQTENQWLSLMKAETEEEQEKQALSLIKADPGKIVASLNLGFWCAFFRKEYETNLWRKILRGIFPKDMSLSRSKINKLLNPIRRLRNRIAHHEPILYWNLEKYYQNCLILTEWLSPSSKKWIIFHSSFEGLYKSHGSIVEAVRDFEQSKK